MKELILTVSTLGRYGSLEKTELTVSTLESAEVLKELILTVSTLGRYGSLERTEFNSFYFGKEWQS